MGVAQGVGEFILGAGQELATDDLSGQQNSNASARLVLPWLLGVQMAASDEPKESVCAFRPIARKPCTSILLIFSVVIALLQFIETVCGDLRNGIGGCCLA